MLTALRSPPARAAPARGVQGAKLRPGPPPDSSARSLPRGHVPVVPATAVPAPGGAPVPLRGRAAEGSRLLRGVPCPRRRGPACASPSAGQLRCHRGGSALAQRGGDTSQRLVPVGGIRGVGSICGVGSERLPPRIPSHPGVGWGCLLPSGARLGGANPCPQVGFGGASPPPHAQGALAAQFPGTAHPAAPRNPNPKVLPHPMGGVFQGWGARA